MKTNNEEDKDLAITLHVLRISGFILLGAGIIGTGDGRGLALGIAMAIFYHKLNKIQSAHENNNNRGH